jgi:hypothetical protein
MSDMGLAFELMAGRSRPCRPPATYLMVDPNC